MSWIAWLVAAIVLVILEISTPGIFFFLSLAVGAFVAAIAAYFGVSHWIDYIIFAVVSILSIFTVRPLFKRYFKRAETAKSNVDALIGAEAMVTAGISPSKDGFVKVMSEIWLANSDEEIKEGEKVKVISVSGTKLFVKK
ncbi:MAG: NfeD family protein [Endomicrobia bacterium]|nr:NfeD family protein [Endomicrobiia bacterium]